MAARKVSLPEIEALVKSLPQQDRQRLVVDILGFMQVWLDTYMLRMAQRPSVRDIERS